MLDAAVFQELVESLQAEAATAVYRQFVESAAAFISELSVQHTSERVDTFHTLKGSAAMMGANRMSELAARLQAQSSSVQVEAATRELKQELNRFRAEVSSRLEALGASLDTPQ